MSNKENIEKFSCKLCDTYMGEMLKGKIRNNAAILCSNCWEKTKLAIQMAELAKNQAPNVDLPDFMKNLFK